MNQIIKKMNNARKNPMDNNKSMRNHFVKNSGERLPPNHPRGHDKGSLAQNLVSIVNSFIYFINFVNVCTSDDDY
jgi:hypothetical protein